MINKDFKMEMIEELERKTSTHKAEVVEVVLQPHPNADSLSIVEVYGFTVCVNTEAWKGQKLGIYIQPDTLVKVSRPEFEFLKNGRDVERIKVRKLRGIISEGLLVPCLDNDAEIGDDYWERLELERYNPPIKGESRPNLPRGQTESGPNTRVIKYDLDNFRRYSNMFVEDEPVIVLEKLDGANARYVYSEDKMYIGSRTQWKKHDLSCPWSLILEKYPQIENLCKAIPGHVIYGEVFGEVQQMKYGAEKGEYFFAAFDIFNGERFLDFEDAYNLAAEYNVPWVPVIEKNLPFSKEKVLTLADGRSTIEGANHIREGVVVRPAKERYDRRLGRVCLKVVSNAYLMKEFD